MNIGVIGPGDIGEAIIRKLRGAGYSVKMANSRGPESLKDLAASTGAIPVSIEQVVQEVDMLFIAVPQKSIPNLPKGLLNNRLVGIVAALEFFEHHFAKMSHCSLPPVTHTLCRPPSSSTAITVATAAPAASFLPAIRKFADLGPKFPVFLHSRH